MNLLFSPDRLLVAEKPLYKRRPKELDEEIGRVFKRLRNEVPNYLRILGGENYKYGPYDDINTNNVIDGLLTSREHINVLDVGAGVGGFIAKAKNRYDQLGLGHRVDIYGITAHDLKRNSSDRYLNEHYKIGNAENILNYYPKNKFDLIVSSETMTHLIDPVGTLQQLYELLTPGGILIVDSFNLPGIADQLPNLIKYLKEQGYEIAVDYKYKITERHTLIDGINSLVIRKTKAKLDLPLAFENEVVKGKANYKLTKFFDPLPRVYMLPESVIRSFDLAFAFSEMDEIDPDTNERILRIQRQYSWLYSTNPNAQDVIIEAWNKLCEDTARSEEERIEGRALFIKAIIDWNAEFKNNNFFNQVLNFIS